MCPALLMELANDSAKFSYYCCLLMLVLLNMEAWLMENNHI